MFEAKLKASTSSACAETRISSSSINLPNIAKSVDYDSKGGAPPAPTTTRTGPYGLHAISPMLDSVEQIAPYNPSGVVLPFARDSQRDVSLRPPKCQGSLSMVMSVEEIAQRNLSVGTG